jgi:uncharacterized protein YwqG
MPGPSEQGDDLAKLSVSELAQAFVDSVLAAEATEHVGRANRLAHHRSQIEQELKARGEARSVLQQLADHPDAQVRASAASALRWLDQPASEPAAEVVRDAPLRPESLWQCDNPPPPALTRDEIVARLRRSVPEACERLIHLALPAIGLWPQRRAPAATASRFGGMPLAPPEWQWPIVQDEPLLFVGQINCAELRGLPGAELLPSSGLLAFFGDHDAVTGCFPFDSGGVFHWPETAGLVPAAPPIPPIEIFPSCALVLRPILDLPDPSGHAVRELGLNSERQKAYTEAWQEMRDHGFPPDCAYYAGFSKLLGWPHIVQDDLGRLEMDGDSRLLLQVDGYCNGEDKHHWGPGGSLYYLLPERDLRAHIFEGCELEGQFT